MDFKYYTTDPTAPVTDPFAITPSDENDLPRPIKGFHVGGNGNISVVAPNGNTVTYTGLVAGNFYPYAATRVLATNTTATNLIGFGIL